MKKPGPFNAEHFEAGFLDSVYVLNDDHTVRHPISTQEWCDLWARTDWRIVAQDKAGDFKVSTVFLGIDHSFTGNGPPVLFETAVIDVGDVGDVDIVARYCTWDEAVAGHAEILKKVKADGKRKIRRRL